MSLKCSENDIFGFQKTLKLRLIMTTKFIFFQDFHTSNLQHKMLTKCFLFFKIGLNVLVETFLKRFFGYFFVLSKEGILCVFSTHHTGVKIPENRVFVIHHNGLKNFEFCFRSFAPLFMFKKQKII